jgi:hypothetical protein
MDTTLIKTKVDLPIWQGLDTPFYITDIIQETHDVYTFRFQGNPLCRVVNLPGQFCTLVLNINGKKVRRYDAYIFRSATYHGDMMQIMKTMLFLAEKVNLQGKVGGSLGAFGWSGEVSVRIYDTMKNIFKMDVVIGPLRLKSASLGGGAQTAWDYGREVGKGLSVS